MSKPRLTKEQKKIRKDLIRYFRDRNKEERKVARKVGVMAILTALAVQELIKGKD